jgi:hypothetical protein
VELTRSVSFQVEELDVGYDQFRRVVFTPLRVLVIVVTAAMTRRFFVNEWFPVDEHVRTYLVTKMGLSTLSKVRSSQVTFLTRPIPSKGQQ